MLRMVVRCSLPVFVGQKCGAGLTNRRSDWPVINEAVRQPVQAFNYKLQSERSHRFLPQPEAPMEFKPTQAQTQSRLLAKLDRGATNMISFGGLFTTEIAESHGCNSVPHSF